MKPRIGILTSHPIQYQAPWFRALAGAFELEVFFAHRQSAAEQGRAGYGVAFEWDMDLLSGYPHRFLKNVARAPNVNRFAGCDTPEIGGIISAGRFDAFVVTGWYLKSFWQAVRACRRNRVPVLVRGDSHLNTPRAWWRRTVKAVTHRWLVRQFDGFLVVGRRNREYLTHYGVNAARMFPGPHFVDHAWFASRAAAAGPERPRRRAAWGCPPEALAVLFVGRFIPEKRAEDLLRAAARARANGLAVVPVMVGAGGLEADLRKLAAELQVPAHFTGFLNQSELPACYAAADVLVLPSESETWGLVVNEAMACGRPAIVSHAVGCAPDLITPGETGFTFPTREVVRLAECLEQCAHQLRAGHDFQPALAARLRQYSVEAAVAGVLQAVGQLGRSR